jgi:hypothetical protein
METTSLNSSPLTSDSGGLESLDPDKNDLGLSANSSLRSCAVELADELYNLCPWQDSPAPPQVVAGTNRSLLPVSNATVSDTASDGNIKTDSEVIPVKVTAGVPIEMVPNQKVASLSVNGTVTGTVPRLFNVLIPLERGCRLPVFFSCAFRPLWILL